MILNKFSLVFLSNKIKTLCFQLLALSLFSCNKSAYENANKSFVGLTHVAYGVGPISMTINGAQLFSSPLSFGLTTGFDGNPYDTTVSRISEMNVFLAQDPTMNLKGNTAFQQGSHYSAFFFDALDSSSVGLIIFQDNPPVRYDTFTTIRFLNFSPGTSIGIKLIYINNYNINDSVSVAVRDTINIGPSPFVGYNLNPAIPGYSFSQHVHIGTNQVFAFVDSAKPASDSSNFMRLDSLQFDSTKNYNIYLQGFLLDTTAQNKLQVKSVRIN